MADAPVTNDTSTPTLNEVSLPVDGKGWVDLLQSNAAVILSQLQELASQTTLTSPLQAAIDSLSGIAQNVLLHVRISTFAGDTSNTNTTGIVSATADPVQAAKTIATVQQGTSNNDNSGGSITNT